MQFPLCVSASAHRKLFKFEDHQFDCGSFRFFGRDSISSSFCVCVLLRDTNPLRAHSLPSFRCLSLWKGQKKQKKRAQINYHFFAIVECQQPAEEDGKQRNLDNPMPIALRLKVRTINGVGSYFLLHSNGQKGDAWDALWCIRTDH